MVSELAGEGAMPLPKPASHAELQVRLRRQIRRGSSLRRGVFPANTVALFNPSIVFIPLSLDGSSRSRSVEISSRVLVNPLCAVFNRTSWSRSVRSSAELVNPMFAVFNRTSWSRSMRSSVELVNPLLDSVCLSEALINALIIVFNCSSRSRSAKGTSTVLVNQPRVCAVEIVCCVSTGFAYRSRMREAPNVTPTRRWPAIPIIVQSSPAKDRSGNSKPSDQQRSPGKLKLSSTFSIRSLDSDFACVNCFSDIDESIAGLMNDEQNFVPGIDHVERFLSQSLEIDDSSSEEIEDEVENLDDGDDERLKAVNKVRRRRRFVVADEDKDVNMLQDANVGVMDAHSFVWNLATVFGEWKSQYLDDSSQHSGNSQSFLDDSQMKDKTEKEDFNKNKKNKIHEANGWKASLTAVMVKALSDVLFGIGTDLNTSEQKNNDDRFADVSFRSSNGKVHEYDPFSELTFDKPRSAEVRPVPSGSGPKSKQDAEKQSRQIKLCTKVPPSSSKRSCYGGSILQLGTKNIDKASQASVCC